MNKKTGSIIGLILLGIILFAGGIFFGQAQASASRINFGGMMDGSFENMNGSFGNMGSRFGMMNGEFGMMDGGAGMMGSIMGNVSGLSNSDPLTLEEAETAVSDYLASLNNSNLELGEIMIFANHAYAQALDKTTGDGAFEVLVDPVTGNVFPEPGPNMMWNSEYSPMGGMMGAGMMDGAGMMGSSGFAANEEGRVNVEKVIKIAQGYLDISLPGTTASNDVTTFPSYFTLHIEQDNEIIGMMSVNAATGDVFPHFWHGDFITMSEHDA